MLSEEHINQILSNIDICFNRTYELLSLNLVVNQNFTGWRQFLGPSDSVGVFGSACGLTTLCAINPKDSRLIAQIVKYLKSIQLQDGSWDSPTILPDLGLTTATCHCVMALKSAGLPANDKHLEKACNWLISNIQQDGCIGNYAGDKNQSFISTALTIRALKCIGLNQFLPEINRIIGRIVSFKNDDGGFSQDKGISTIHHSSVALLALSNLESLISNTSRIIEESYSYIIENISFGQNIGRDIDYVELKGRRAMLPYTYQTDGILLQALLTYKNAIYDENIFSLVSYIIESQKEGSWEHQTIPGKKPSWAIMESIIGLKEFYIRAEKNKHFISIEIDLKRLEEKIDRNEQIISESSEKLSGLIFNFMSLWPIFKYRYIIVTLYLGSIYMFIRSSFGNLASYSDYLATGVAIILCCLQLFSGFTNKSDQ